MQKHIAQKARHSSPSPRREFPRVRERNELQEVVSSKKATFLYVRGRRRVGKSWLLSDIADANKSVLYFSGAKDAKGRTTMRQFVNAWTKFSESPNLAEIKLANLDWRRVFEEIQNYLRTHQRMITFIFDEIQWIAKTGSGFVGALKEAWVKFEKLNLANIIVCGSSNKFFNDHTGGEEKLLRGLQTRAPLIIKPLTLGQMRTTFFPRWHFEEVALLYMLVGGIPYYLQQFQSSGGFVNSINQGVFTPHSIFLSEVDDLLGLEFNKLGLKNIKRILAQLAVYGSTQAQIRRNSKIASSTLSELFGKLQDYGVVGLIRNFAEPSTIVTQGVENRYTINDFFLNSFFSIFSPLQSEILNNHQARNNIFANRVLRHKNYYIENFTGKAFERLIEYCFLHYDRESYLFKALQLGDSNFEISTHHTQQEQIDLILQHNSDRVVRALECKWDHKPELRWIDELIQKKLPLQQGFTRMNGIIIGTTPSKAFLKHAKDRDVVVVGIEDLF